VILLRVIYEKTVHSSVYISFADSRLFHRLFLMWKQSQPGLLSFPESDVHGCTNITVAGVKERVALATFS